MEQIDSIVFTNLPDETILNIIEHMDVKSLGIFGRISKRMLTLTAFVLDKEEIKKLVLSNKKEEELFKKEDHDNDHPSRIASDKASYRKFASSFEKINFFRKTEEEITKKRKGIFFEEYYLKILHRCAFTSELTEILLDSLPQYNEIALIYACRQGYSFIVVSLIKRKVEVSFDNNTSLRIACVKGYHSIVQLILSSEFFFFTPNTNNIVGLATNNDILKDLLSNDTILSRIDYIVLTNRFIETQNKEMFNFVERLSDRLTSLVLVKNLTTRDRLFIKENSIRREDRME